MKLRETAKIRASRETVWQLIADPAQWAAWNEKLVSFQRARTGPVVAGEQFSSRWTLNQNERQTNVLVLSVTPMEKIHLRQEFEFKNRTRHIDLIFAISGHAPRLRLDLSLDPAGSGAPLILRALMWFIQRFGKPVGTPFLENLRRLAEQR